MDRMDWTDRFPVALDLVDQIFASALEHFGKLPKVPYGEISNIEVGPSGIYLIYDQEVLVYVGMTDNTGLRLRDHVAPGGGLIWALMKARGFDPFIISPKQEALRKEIVQAYKVTVLQMSIDDLLAYSRPLEAFVQAVLRPQHGWNPGYFRREVDALRKRFKKVQ